MIPKRSKLKQWIDKFFYKIKTDKEIEEERRIQGIVQGIMSGNIKRETYFIPTFPWLGGGYKSRYIFKSHYTKEEWEKKP